MATQPLYDPQKALLVSEPPTTGHELKLDGFRMGVFIARQRGTRNVQIISRNGNEFTNAYPEIDRTALTLSCQSGTLDGEIVDYSDVGADGLIREVSDTVSIRRAFPTHGVQWLHTNRPSQSHCPTAREFPARRFSARRMEIPRCNHPICLRSN